MSLPAIFVLVLSLLAAVVLVSNRLSPDLVAMIVMVILGLSGVVSAQDVFSGFSGSAVMTILGISIISEGLRQTGVAYGLGQVINRLGKNSEWRLILVVTLVSAALSLFMNNIAAVGILFPAVITVSRQSKTPPSLLLLPLAYGTSMGGMATLLTTPNIIVSGALREAGFRPFGLLNFFPIGAPVIIIGSLYLITLGRYLLHKQDQAGKHLQTQQLRTELINLYDLQNNIFEIEVSKECPFADKSIVKAEWAKSIGLTVLGLAHPNMPVRLGPSKKDVINSGDHLLVQGSLQPEVLESFGLKIVEGPAKRLPIANETITLAELVIPPHGRMIGKNLRQLNFREIYNLNVLAVWRGNSVIQCDLSELSLMAGDALLVQGQANHIRLLKNEPDLLVLKEDPDVVIKPQKRRLAVIITLITLAVAALGYLPTAEVVLSGAILLVLSKCMNMSDAYQSIEWRAIFLIAGMWPLSTAINSTGLASALINNVIAMVGNLAPLTVALLLIILALILTQFMGGQVAALVVAPIAITTATTLNIDPRALGMAAALGCSLSFPTPLGHPVNIMVMGAGGYAYKDYLRMGVPLTLLAIPIILLGLHFFMGI